MRLYSATTKYIFITVTGVLVVVFYFVSSSSGTEKTILYFHSSESNINNFKSLKMGFDNYLAPYGAYEMQPIEERAAFERQIASTPDCLFLVSSWHYRQLAEKIDSRPILIGKRNGKKTQKRILISRQDLRNPIATDITIASASSIGHTQSVIQQMLVDRAVGPLRILTVPKDIDALMAVSFGMSGAALITENNFLQIKAITPALCRKVKICLSGPEIYLLILAAPASGISRHRRLIRLIQEMPQTPLGKKQIRMLGLDSFEAVSNADLILLQPHYQTTGREGMK